MKEGLFEALVKYTPRVIVLCLMWCYGLSQARRVTNDIANNADKLGVDVWQRSRAVHKALFNFYLVLALIFVISIRSLELIQNDLFIGLLVAILTGLGIKLTTDIREKKDK